MKVYADNLIGLWSKEQSGTTYRFMRNGTLIVRTGEKQVVLDYQIITKQRESALLIGESRFLFIDMNPGANPGYFSVITKSGLVMFRKEKEQ